jgi:hypothetical protein
MNKSKFQAHKLKMPPLPQARMPIFTTTPHHTSTAPPAPSLTSVLTHGNIAERAYDLYVQSGYQQEQSLRNWVQAEKDLHHQGLLACHAEHLRKEVFAPDAIDAP